MISACLFVPASFPKAKFGTAGFGRCYFLFNSLVDVLIVHGTAQVD